MPPDDVGRSEPAEPPALAVHGVGRVAGVRDLAVPLRRGAAGVCALVGTVRATGGDADRGVASALVVSAGRRRGSRGGRLVDDLRRHGDEFVARFGGQPRLTLELLDEVDEFGTARSPARHCGARDVLAVLDEDVGIHRHAEEVVGRIAVDPRPVAADAPVVGQADLVDGASADGQGRHPLGDEDTGLDRSAWGDECRPPIRLEAEFLGELR